MNQFMQAVVSTMKTQKSYRSVVALVATACASVLLSACIGGGGGDSSGTEVDLPAAYEKIQGCMDRNDLINIVGVAPNDVDASNTMIWEAGKYRLMVFLQLWDSGLYIASTKYLIGPGADRQTVIDSCED
ncbi:hypothetical protein [Hydrogenophaga sp.]|uniref:hypothetical protein n=1 Tax=Hydrogenophaga sp. TaxID=1904254 RepID=UPI0035AEE9F4